MPERLIDYLPVFRIGSKLVVMVSKKGAFELLQKIGKNPSLKEASLTALITWTPEVMNKLDYSRS
jgi:hypothetical protein